MLKKCKKQLTTVILNQPQLRKLHRRAHRDPVQTSCSRRQLTAQQEVDGSLPDQRRRRWMRRVHRYTRCSGRWNCKDKPTTSHAEQSNVSVHSVWINSCLRQCNINVKDQLTVVQSVNTNGMVQKEAFFQWTHVLRKEGSCVENELYKVLHQVRDANEDERR